ncbi:hypothetical protein GGS20DRAFT_571977 [Poronia punctata]|nr:hypothetical protein GGS20DRAFT_571977 [Poronia punctata]
MAAPASKTIADLSGKWRLNKSLSDNTDPALQLQGISWLTRKIIANATVNLTVKQYTDANGIVHIEIDQEASGVPGGGSHEHRTLDFQERELTDRVFGTIRGQTKFVSTEEIAIVLAEKSLPGLEHLAADWIAEEKNHVFNHVRSVADGWTATQVWGFQIVGGERRYVRNVVVAKGDESQKFKMVYDFVE